MQIEEEERQPYRNEFKMISRANSPKSHKSEESKSLGFVPKLQVMTSS